MTTVLDALRENFWLGDEPVHTLEQWLDATLAEVEGKVKIAMSAPRAAPGENFQVSSSGSESSEVTRSVGILETLRLPSPGYEPFLIDAGFQPLIARGFAKLVGHRARRLANDSKWRRPVFDALRFLAQRDRQPCAILRRAKLLIRACDESSILETVFDKAGFNEFEFIDLLTATVADQPVNHDRIRQIAVFLLSHLSTKRGPTMRAASIAHEYCLSQPQIAQHLKQGPPETQQNRAEYVDALTQATRREFGLPDFDSRPARRRLNAENTGKTPPR